MLYVCGFASTVILGTWAPIAAEKFGRKKLCVFFSIIYSLACFFKLSRSYGILILGKVLGGVATSLLFSAFEAWYVHAHLENDFPKEWIAVTFTKAATWNGILAILAGIVGNTVAEWMNFGPVSPFMLAIPCLIASGIVVMTQWKENYSKHQVHFAKPCMNGLREIVAERRIFLIGIIQSLFESVMYIFIFLWTPVLDPGKPSLGIVFSSFMVCIMIGSALFQILSSRQVPVLHLLCISIILALSANILCVLATHPDHMSRNLAFTAFLMQEVAVGVYFHAMGQVRAKVLPEANRSSILNWFRVPLNLIACLLLMSLHNDAVKHGNRMLFISCVALLAIAALCTFKFIAMARDDEDFQGTNDGAEEESSTRQTNEIWLYHITCYVTGKNM